jgi:hypothetical protein
MPAGRQRAAQPGVVRQRQHRQAAQRAQARGEAPHQPQAGEVKRHDVMRPAAAHVLQGRLLAAVDARPAARGGGTLQVSALWVWRPCSVVPRARSTISLHAVWHPAGGTCSMMSQPATAAVAQQPARRHRLSPREAPPAPIAARARRRWRAVPPRAHARRRTRGTAAARAGTRRRILLPVSAFHILAIMPAAALARVRRSHAVDSHAQRAGGWLEQTSADTPWENSGGASGSALEAHSEREQLEPGRAAVRPS